MTLPPRPPRLADWLLRRCLPHGAAGESVRGDLYEEFCLRDPPGGGRDMYACNVTCCTPSRKRRSVPGSQTFL